MPSLLIVFYSLSKNAPDANKIRDLENQTNTEVTIKRLPSPKAKEEKVHFAHANSINVRGEQISRFYYHYLTCKVLCYSYK